jgi:glycosyltransferase involved in cell wall biosynthesis
MRILHISTSVSGGAGVAAMRLLRAQAATNHEVFLHTRSHNSQGFQRGSFWRALSGLNTQVQSHLTRSEYELITPVSITNTNLKKINSLKPDIVHIHNWFNILTMNEIELISKSFPVVLNVHDERLLTGACHITFDCSRYLSGCKKCPQIKTAYFLPEMANQKTTRFLTESGPIAVVAPSFWLASKFESYPGISKKIKVSKISNIISGIIEMTKAQYSTALVNVLFVSAEVMSVNKGFTQLMSALKSISLKFPLTQFNLTVVGNHVIETIQFSDNLRFDFVGICDEKEVAIIMANSNILLVPSKSENSPNVIAEAQSRELLVAASNVGGISELIKDWETGLLFLPDEEGIENAILKYLEMGPDRHMVLTQRAKSESLIRHDTQKIIDQFNLAYEEMLMESI